MLDARPPPRPSRVARCGRCPRTRRRGYTPSAVVAAGRRARAPRSGRRSTSAPTARRGVTLTEHGAALARHAERIMSADREARPRFAPRWPTCVPRRLRCGLVTSRRDADAARHRSLRAEATRTCGDDDRGDPTTRGALREREPTSTRSTSSSRSARSAGTGPEGRPARRRLRVAPPAGARHSRGAVGCRSPSSRRAVDPGRPRRVDAGGSCRWPAAPRLEKIIALQRRTRTVERAPPPDRRRARARA